MGNYIVTIARQYGSGGREVGHRLSELTGYSFYDRQMITLTAEQSGLSVDALTNADETAANSFLYAIAMATSSAAQNRGIDVMNLPLNDRLFVIQSEIIKKRSSEDNGSIFVGRCADYVLNDHPNLVRVFIKAPFDVRVQTVMKQHDIDQAKAESMIVKADKRRANYYNYYTGEKWGRIDRYDLVISTDRIGVEGAAEMIREYLNQLDKQ